MNAWLDVRRDVEGMSPSDAATHVLRLHDVQIPPVDVVSIADRIGISVRYVASPGWLGACRINEAFAKVWVDSAAGEIDRRVILAHEIGHILMHSMGHQYRDLEFWSYIKDPKEMEAYWFAAELLVPLNMLGPVVGAVRRTTSELACLFHVPTSVMGSQLERLL